MLHINFAVEKIVEIKCRRDFALFIYTATRKTEEELSCTITMEIISGENV